MNKFLISFLSAICIVNCSAQKVVDVDKESGNANVLNYVYTVAGVPFVNTKFTRVVEGSPFFNEKMMKGAIILSEGKEYRNILVRINLLEAQVNYIDDKQTELVATTPIREVVLWDTANGADHRFVYSEYIGTNEKIEKGFYELLQTGSIELYKEYKKTLSGSKPYGSATEEQRIQTINNYFVLKAGQWKKIKKLKDLVALFNDKATEMKQFMLTNQISGDNQFEFEKVVGHYNSLF